MTVHRATITLDKNELIEAIEGYLRVKEQLPKNLRTADIKLERGILVWTGISEYSIPERPQASLTKISKRNNPGGHRKGNHGFFKTARLLVQQYIAEGRNVAPLNVVIADIKINFPRMNDEKIIQYLRDRRQVKNIEVDRISKVVRITQPDSK